MLFALFAPLAAPDVARAQTPAKPVVKANSGTASGDVVAEDAVFVPLQGSVPSAVAAATKLAPMKGDQKLSLLVCFQFADPQAAEDYANAVSDPHSLLYRQWLTPQEVGLKFGPDPADYAAMVAYLQSNGFQIEETPVNRLTVRASGTVGQAQQAFGVTLSQYRETAAQAQALRGAGALPYAFCAPDGDVQLPGALAGKITSVEGLENYTRPIPLLKKAKLNVTTNFDAVVTRNAYDLAGIYNSYIGTATPPGTGRTIGISNFDGVNPATNVPLYITRNSLPYPSAGKGTNVTRITVTSSSGTSGQGEGDLDVEMAIGQAPLASVIIYDDGATTGNPLLSVLAKEVNDNLADVLTESYGWNLSSSAIASCHTQHVTMTTQGQTYLTASGDSGNIASSAYQYSDYEPEVLIIGGTNLTASNSPSYAYVSEAGWGSGTLGSGGGVSSSTATFNSHTGTGGALWQTGRNVPTTNKRYAPDIAFHSAAAGNGGAYYFYYGGSLNGGAVGTSFASPMAAGQIALMEQDMIAKGLLTANANGKYRLGRMNDKFYGFNGRNDIFHDITTGGASPALGTTPYWDQTTGWGSVDWANLEVAWFTPLSVTVTPTGASVNPGQTQPLTATVAGSNVKTVIWTLSNGPGAVSASGVYTAPASVTAGATPVTATVKATSALNTANAGVTTATFQPNPVFGQATINLVPSSVTISGTVTLEGVSDPSTTAVTTNAVTFIFTPTGGGSPVTVTQTLGAGGSFSVSNLPAASYSVNIEGDKWLSATTTADASLTNVSGITVTLLAGDANNDNTVDASDFGLLVTAYNSSVSVPGSGYDPAADFNNDGSVDATDFGLLVGNYNTTGQ